MIGISISSDSIRAVRLNRSKKQFTVKDCAIADLYDGDIVEGRIRNIDGFKESLRSIKDAMKIKDNEDVYVGIPNGNVRIGTIAVKAETNSIQEVINLVPIIGNKKNFDFDIPFISENYKVQDKLKAEEQEFDDQGNMIPSYHAMKNVSYCVVGHEIISEYANAVSDCGMSVVSVEPTALATIRYLRFDATQPFVVIDMEYDYTTMIAFSEQFGAFTLNLQDLGIKNLTLEQYDADGDEVIGYKPNTANIIKLCKRLGLLEKYYFGEYLGKDENSQINQIIFLNNDYQDIIDKVLEYFQRDLEDGTLDALSAQDMIPNGMAKKLPKNVPAEDLYLYFKAMVIACNGNTKAFEVDSYSRNVEVNMVPPECIEKTRFSRIKKDLLIGMAGITVLSVGYSGYNIANTFKDIYSNDDANKVTPDLQAKYEDAQKQSRVMKDNIAKFNTISKNKKTVSPLVDKVVASKPDDIALLSMNVNYKSKRAIIECVTDNADSMNVFLQNMKQNKDFEAAQINTSQTKNNKTAFQISIPLEGGVATKTKANNSKNSKTNNNSSSKTTGK